MRDLQFTLHPGTEPDDGDSGDYFNILLSNRWYAAAVVVLQMNQADQNVRYPW